MFAGPLMTPDVPLPNSLTAPQGRHRQHVHCALSTFHQAATCDNCILAAEDNVQQQPASGSIRMKLKQIAKLCRTRS
jgi:hypothetical protein